MKKINDVCSHCGSKLSVRQLVLIAVPKFKKKAFTINDIQKIINKPYDDIKAQLRYLRYDGKLMGKDVLMPSKYSSKNQLIKVFMNI